MLISCCADYETAAVGLNMTWPQPDVPFAAAVIDKTLENAVTAQACFWAATYVLISGCVQAVQHLQSSCARSTRRC